MYTNSTVGNTQWSLDQKCKDLCKNGIIINSVKLHSKYKKKEGNTKVKKSVSLTR